MSIFTRICTPLSAKDRRKEYDDKFAEFDEEHLRRAANGVIAKRRMLAEIRNRETRKRLAVQGVEITVRKPRLSLAR